MPQVTKRKRGRPSKLQTLKSKIEVERFTGSQEWINAYPKAVGYLVGVLEDETASHTNKISAAKQIVEKVEQCYAEILAEEKAREEADGDEEHVEVHDGPVLSLKAVK